MTVAEHSSPQSARLPAIDTPSLSVSLALSQRQLCLRCKAENEAHFAFCIHCSNALRTTNNNSKKKRESPLRCPSLAHTHTRTAKKDTTITRTAGKAPKNTRRRQREDSISAQRSLSTSTADDSLSLPHTTTDKRGKERDTGSTESSVASLSLSEDLPESVRRALLAPLSRENDSRTAIEREIATQQQALRALTLEMENAQRLERVYSALSLAEHSVESLDSAGSGRHALAHTHSLSSLHSGSFSRKRTSEKFINKLSEREDHLAHCESVVSLREKMLRERRSAAGVLGQSALPESILSEAVDKHTPSTHQSQLDVLLSLQSQILREMTKKDTHPTSISPIKESSREDINFSADSAADYESTPKRENDNDDDSEREGRAWLWGDCLSSAASFSQQSTTASLSSADILTAQLSRAPSLPAAWHMSRSVAAMRESVRDASSIASKGSFFWGDVVQSEQDREIWDTLCVDEKISPSQRKETGHRDKDDGNDDDEDDDDVEEVFISPFQVPNNLPVVMESEEREEETTRTDLYEENQEKHNVNETHEHSHGANTPLENDDKSKLTEKSSAHANLSIGKLYMSSCEALQRHKDALFVDLRIDAQTLSEEELRSWRGKWSAARSVVTEGEALAQGVMDAVKAFHERARLQRAAAAERIAETLRKSAEIEKFFREQYEQERAQFVAANASLLRVTAVSEIVTEDMKNIRAKGQEALQRVGEEIKALQIKEAETLRTLKQEEFAVLETIRHWRPRHLRHLCDLNVAVARVSRWLGNRLDGHES